ncbi:MAG: hypothetical protein GDA41_10490 [Rhodospirillales bacterium]|nr:hypothetical protein [Rhodospirillales bacterium]
MTSNKSGQGRRTTPAGKSTHNRRTEAKTTAMPNTEDTLAESSGKAAEDKVSNTAVVDSIGDAGDAKETLTGDSESDAGSTVSGDDGKDRLSDAAEEATADLPHSHKLTAQDALSNGSVASDSPAESIHSATGSERLTEAHPVEADTKGEDDDKVATGGSGGGSGSGGYQPPPPAPPVVARNGSMIKGIVVGGLLVIVGFILAVGTSDLWMGHVISGDRWDAQNKKIDAAQKAADGAEGAIAALTIKVEDLAKGGDFSAALKSLTDKFDGLAQGTSANKVAVAGLKQNLEALKTGGQSNLAALTERTTALKDSRALGPEVSKEIEGMRAAVSHMEGRVNTLINRLTSDPKAVEDAIAAVKQQADRLANDLSAMSAKFDAAVTELRSELTSLEGRGKEAADILAQKLFGGIEAVTQEIVSAKTSLKDLSGKVGNADKILSDTLGKVDANRQQLTGLDGKVYNLEGITPQLQSDLADVTKEVGEAKTKLGKLSDELTRFSKLLNERIDSAISAALAKDMRPRAAALTLAATSLSDAVQRGGSFQGKLDAVAKLAAEAPEMQDDLANLNPLASAGVSSLGGLLASFRAQIPTILAAASGEEPHDSDFLNEAWGAVSGLVDIRPVGEITGDTPKAIVARVEQRLLASNLGEAITVAASLKGAAAAAAAPWLTEARARLLALQSAERLQQIALASLAAQQN